MERLSRHSVYLGMLAVAGILVSVSYTIADGSAAIALILGATTAAVVPLLWWGPALMRDSYSLDERFEKIHHRSGWYSYVLLSWVVLTYVGVEILTARALPVQLLFTGFLCVTVAYGAIRVRLT